MRAITYRDVTEVQPHVFVAEASQLGLAPGEWPKSFKTAMGNSLPLRQETTLLDGGEFQGIVYRQALGCIEVHVLND